MSPASGPVTGCTKVTITGTGLTSATAVHFGTQPATSYTVNSATSMTATAPARVSTGQVDITVTAFDGSTSTTTSADHYTYE